MKTVVSARGRITIPKALRSRLGIGPGTILEVREEQGALVFTKQVATDAFDEVTGILELDADTDGLIGELRGKAGEH
jgi:antitoxin PrlF